MTKELLAKLFKCAPDTGTGSEGVSDVDNQQNDTDGESSSGDGFKAPQSQSELDSYTNKAIQKALENQRKDEAKRIDDAVKNALAKEKTIPNYPKKNVSSVNLKIAKKPLKPKKPSLNTINLWCKSKRILSPRGCRLNLLNCLLQKMQKMH